MQNSPDMELHINKLRLDKFIRLSAGMRVSKEERERLRAKENPMDVVLFPAGKKKAE